MIVDIKDFDAQTIAAAMGTRISSRTGDAIFRRGDKADCMYVVLTGAVAVSIHGRVIQAITPGNALGILSLIDGSSRSNDAVAESDTDLALIDARRFRYMVEEVPNFVWYAMRELATRLRATSAAM